MFSSCFLLALASYGFSGVQSYAALRVPGGADDYGAVNWPGKDCDSYSNSYNYGNLNKYPGNVNSITSRLDRGLSNKQAPQPGLAVFTGGIFGIMGMLPMSAISPEPSVQSHSLHAESKGTMKKFDEQLQAMMTLKALDDLKKDVKAPGLKPSKRFLQYN